MDILLSIGIYYNPTQVNHLGSRGEATWRWLCTCVDDEVGCAGCINGGVSLDYGYFAAVAKVRAGLSPAHCVLSRRPLCCPAACLRHAVALGRDVRAAYAHSAQACCSWALQIPMRCLGACATRLHDVARVCRRVCTRTPCMLLRPAATPRATRIIAAEPFRERVRANFCATIACER